MVRCAKKTSFKFLLFFAIEMAVLSVFQQKGLGPLGSKSNTKMVILKVEIEVEQGAFHFGDA